MKRLDFSKPVTRQLTPESNDYTNPNTNPTRLSRHVTWTGGRSPGGNHREEITGGKLLEGNHRGKNHLGEVHLLRRIYRSLLPSHPGQTLQAKTPGNNPGQKPLRI